MQKLFSVLIFVLVSFTTVLAGDDKLLKEVRGKVVAVPNPVAPGEFIGWYFDAKDKLTIKKIDEEGKDRQLTIYTTVDSKTSNGMTLEGIMELHYTKIAKEYYLVGLGSINLKMTVPSELLKKTDAPTKGDSGSQTKPAQPLPGQK